MVPLTTTYSVTEAAHSVAVKYTESNHSKDFICNVQGTSVKTLTPVHFHSLVNLSNINWSVVKEAADQNFALI